MAAGKTFKRDIERKLAKLLNRKTSEKIEKEDLQILSLGIKYLAVSAKMDEEEWGKELGGLDEGGEPDEPEIDN